VVGDFASDTVQVAIEAVGTGIQDTAAEPFDLGLVEVVAENGGPFFFPGQILPGRFGPQHFRLLDGLLVKGLIGLYAVDVCGLPEIVQVGVIRFGCVGHAYPP
jgi:hypothetical protein